jgi:hypothetical protein
VLSSVGPPNRDCASWRDGDVRDACFFLAPGFWDVFGNPLTESVNGFPHSAAAALSFQATVPTGWRRRAAGSASAPMGAAGIGVPLLCFGLLCSIASLRDTVDSSDSGSA